MAQPSSSLDQRSRWSVVTGLFITIAVVFSAVLQTPGILFTPLLKDFKWSRRRTSLLSSASLTTRGLSAPLVGWLMDRFNTRNLMIAGTLACGLCMVAVSRARSFAPILAAYAVLGLGVGAATLLPASLIIARWFERNRGLAMGLAMTGCSLGGVIMPLIADYAVAVGGWPAAYVVLATLILVIAVPVLLLMVPGAPPTEAHFDTPRSPQPALSGLEVIPALRTRSFWMVTLAQTCSSFAVSAMVVHLVPDLIVLGYAPAFAALVMSLTFAVSAPAIPTMGWLADRIESRFALALSFALESAGIALLIALPHRTAMTAFIITFGLGFQCAGTLLPLVTVRSLGLRRYGSLSGLIRLGGTLGAALGPFTTGWIFDRVGSYRPAFLLLVIILIVGIIAALQCAALPADQGQHPTGLPDLS